MTQVLSLILFAIFVGIVIAVRLAAGPGAKQRRVTVLVLYLIAIHVALAVARRDAWPFATNGVSLERSDAARPLTNIRFTAVDQSGREYRIDPDTWSPLSDRTLENWWLMHFDRLQPDEHRRVLAFLLERAEETRRARAAGRRIGRSRLLGPAAAPFWYSLDSTPPPSEMPFVALRVYLVTRTPAEKEKSGYESATLIAESRR